MHMRDCSRCREHVRTGRHSGPTRASSRSCTYLSSARHMGTTEMNAQVGEVMLKEVVMVVMIQSRSNLVLSRKEGVAEDDAASVTVAQVEGAFVSLFMGARE